MKCQARILRDYKTTKADCMWPETQYGPSDVGTLLVCGGEVTVKASAVNEPEWGGSYARLEISCVCSRCKHPYFKGRLTLDHQTEIDITLLFETFNKEE